MLCRNNVRFLYYARSRTSSTNNLVFQRRSESAAAAKEKHAPLYSEAKPFHEMPGPGGMYRIPYLGTALYFKPFTDNNLNNMKDILVQLREKYGDIFKMRLGKKYVVMVAHPDLVKELLKLPFEEHRRHRLDIFEAVYKRNPGRIPGNLGTLNGEEWAALRKPTQEKMLRPAIVTSYIPLLETVTNDFVDTLRNKERIDDMLTQLMNYTTESIGMLCFNRRLGCIGDKGSELNEAVRMFFTCLQDSMVMPVKTFSYFKTKLYKDFEWAVFEIDRVAQRELQAQVETLKQLEKEGKLDDYLAEHPSFVYSLLTDPRLADEQVSSTVTSLLSGGIDSTANSLVFLLGNLALNLDKQAILHQEIVDVIGNSTSIDKNHLSSMHYLKACIKESLRKTFPVSIGFPRILEQDAVIGGYHIPNQTRVIANMSTMSTDGRFFPQPKQFIPERWLRDDSTTDIEKAHMFPFAHKSFGFGPRSCVGQRFAELEMYIAITKIIQNFEVSLPPGAAEIKPVFKTFTSPAEKVTMILKNRNL